MAEKENKSAYYDTRASQRKRAMILLAEAKEENNQEKISKLSELLNNELAFSFEELPWKANYVKSLKEEYFLENDEEFTGEIQELIEEDFEYFNLLDGSIVAGGIELAKIPFADEGAKDRMRTRLNTYINTSAIGKGSRDTTQQVLGVGKGVALDLATTGGAGTVARLAGKNLGLKALNKFLGPKGTIAAVSSTAAGVSDLERQGLEKEVGLREEINPLQTATSMAIGGVVPSALQPVGKYVTGPVGRTTSSFMQAGARVAQKLGGGQKAAVGKAAEDLSESIAMPGGGMVKGSEDLSINIGKLLDDTQLMFNEGFNNAPIKISIPGIRRIYDDYMSLTKPTEGPKPKPRYKINKDGVEELVEQKTPRIPGLPKINRLDRIMAKVESGQMSPAVALREMKEALTNAHKAAKNGQQYDINDADDLFNFRAEIIKAEQAAANRAGPQQGKQYLELKKDYQRWLDMKDSDIGKKIISAGNNSTDAGSLILEITEGKLSWAKYNKFMEELDFFKSPEMKAKLKENVKRAVSSNLLENDGKGLSKILKSEGGLETLKKLFDSPDNVKYIKNIEDLAIKISGNKKAPPQSHLVHNLMAARLGEKITGSKLAGGSVGIGLLEGIMNSNFMRTRLAHAWKNNKGRLDTSTRNILEKRFGFSRVDVNALQDTMWGLTGAGFVYGSLDRIEAIADPVERRMEEIKAGFSW